MRANNRGPRELRKISIFRKYIHNTPGSVLIEFDSTKVLCRAHIAEGVPRFLRGLHQGWLTAEYGMLPSATSTRTSREAVKGEQTGRTKEIQRLIGRCLRNAIDLSKIPDFTITVDCDVIQADGGTRTAAITGASIAVHDLIQDQISKNVIKTNPIKHLVAAISVGIVKNNVLLDLDYSEDSIADTDMNVIMTDEGKYIEIQGTAEGNSFLQTELIEMLDFARDGISELVELQKKLIHEPMPV